MIKGHGDDLHNYPQVKANFSSNVCTNGPHESLVNHLQNTLVTLEHYPEPCAESLTIHIAECHRLSADQVLVCNGATEAFYLLANQYRGQKSLIFTPSFSEYEDACKSANHVITYVKNSLYETANYTDADLVWLCNPNNPDAFCYDYEILTNIINAHPDTLFVIDEAYIEFTSEVKSYLSEFASLLNVVVIRSMTKRYAIPALRLGYMVAQSAVIKAIETHLMPWRLNTLAIEAGKFVLSADYADDFDSKKALASCQALQNDINAIDGLEVVPSDATFFLVKSTLPSAELKQRLIQDYGLLIRDASNFRGLTDYHFRVAVQTSLDNKLLVQALKDIFKC